MAGRGGGDPVGGGGGDRCDGRGMYGDLRGGDCDPRDGGYDPRGGSGGRDPRGISDGCGDPREGCNQRRGGGCGDQRDGCDLRGVCARRGGCGFDPHGVGSCDRCGVGDCDPRGGGDCNPRSIGDGDPRCRGGGEPHGSGGGDPHNTSDGCGDPRGGFNQRHGSGCGDQRGSCDPRGVCAWRGGGGFDPHGVGSCDRCGIGDCNLRGRGDCYPRGIGGGDPRGRGGREPHGGGCAHPCGCGVGGGDPRDGRAPFPGRRFRPGSGMQTGGPMHGRVQARGTWWDRKEQRLAIEGVDFTQDTQEGGADEFEFIPNLDSCDERGISSVATIDENEVVPETEVQDEVVSGGGVVVDDGMKHEEEVKPSGVKVGSKEHGHRGYSQEDNLEPFQLDMVRLFIPGFTQSLKRKRD